MCGIFGIINSRAEATLSRDRLADTARRLHHRGPDGHGIYADKGVGLVHTRLSLVDLHERSNQPFWDRSGRYALVYNGELYDYAALKNSLERRGVVFRTTADTEVLLEALIQFGVDETLPRLEGMFAFGLYDARERTLVVARDRFGIKPLFFHESDSTFLFASSVAAMRPWLPIEPDLLMVSAFLQGFGGPTAGRSMYQSIQSVPPGGIIRIKQGESARFGQFATLHDFVDPDQAALLAETPIEQLIDQVDERLQASVSAQLCADAPVGALCSGGVDSSLVMAMAARHHPNLTVFHADVVGPCSERPAAESLARHLGLDFQVVAVRRQDCLDTWPEVVQHFGQPFIMHPNAVPVLAVSHMVRDYGVKAVLCGEGSDECFWGYRWLAPNVRALLRGLPRTLFRKISVFATDLERRWRGKGPHPRVSTDDRDLTRGLQSQFEHEIGPAEFADASLLSSLTSQSERSLTNNGALSHILRTLLHRNDSLGMAASIEARFPFLDNRLVKLAVNLPDRCKIRFSPFALDWAHLFYRDKWIIRQVASRYLPKELSHRKKIGFPVDGFQRMRIDDRFFENSYVAGLFGLGRTQLRYLLEHASHALKLRLVHLEAWGRICVLEQPNAELRNRLHAFVRIAGAQADESQSPRVNIVQSPRPDAPVHRRKPVEQAA